MRSPQTICQVTALLLATLMFCASAPGADTKGNEPKQDPYLLDIPMFETESALRLWVAQRLGPCQIVPHEKNGAKVLVILDPRGSGHVVTDIYLFAYNPATRAWGIKGLWRTDTSAVTVLKANRGRQLTFKSKSGKLLLEVPVATLIPTNDPSF